MNTGKIQATIDDRVAKGYGIVSEILALSYQVPLGKYRIEMGLKLRQAMLINGILFNSEAWHSTTKEQVTQFVDIDKYLLRGLVGSHAKVPVEHLYLEMADLPIPYVLSVRRMIYLGTILRRHDNEITQKVYLCQKSSPLPGDWCQMVSNDFNKMGIHMTDEHIAQMHEGDYKKLIKN